MCGAEISWDGETEMWLARDEGRGAICSRCFVQHCPLIVCSVPLFTPCQFLIPASAFWNSVRPTRNAYERVGSGFAECRLDRMDHMVSRARHKVLLPCSSFQLQGNWHACRVYSSPSFGSKVMRVVFKSSHSDSVIKLSPSQAVEAYSVVRRWGSHIV
jgi:hypothetical protein